MRRSDKEVKDPAQIAKIMARCEVVRLALNTDTVPYILPFNFGMEPDGMTLYIHGAMTGTKYEWIAKDSRGSFEMDCVQGLQLDTDAHECSMAYESVIGWGVLEEVTEPAQKRHALERIMAQYHAEAFHWSDGPLPRTRIFRLMIRQRTAKRTPKRM